MKHLLFIIFFIFLFTEVFAQGLEDVIIETYYISDENDQTDTDGGFLELGSTTYRIYLDLAPGYELQAVYGNANHLLRIETSTTFFNNEDRGEETGDALPNNRLDENTVALDSYVTISAASTTKLGVLKTEDTDGSIVGGVNNDGGSAGISNGLLSSGNPLAGVPLTTADGLISGTVPTITVVGLDLGLFADANAGPIFQSNGGAWSVLEGAQGPTPENKILIAQLTTTGDLSFELNVQLGTPDGGVEQFVASNPTNSEIFFNALNFPLLDVPGCTSSTACNFNPQATLDDGSCLEPVENCSICSSDSLELVLIDEDNDGVCDAEEIQGCTLSVSACNYNPNATDEVPCIEPVPMCQECNDDNTGLVLVDSDGDGVCDALEVNGCTSPSACNYDASATEDDQSCIEPTPNCEECNETNDGLILIDSDNDGICDAEENPGCLSITACNYNPEATSDNGSCIEPIENCQICNENNDGLIIVDSDGDGVCDSEEIVGCTSDTACNYNPIATDESSDCIEPVENCEICNENNDGLVLVDSDEDGICDAEEIPGCTNPEACNFNEEASDEDDSCIVPIEDCEECNDDNSGLILVDTDGDGICDANEILGCTDEEALNYNPDATEDDGSCLYVGVEEFDNDLNVTLFPNPNRGVFDLVIKSNSNSAVKYSVRNILGQELKQGIVTPVNNAHRELIDVSEYSNGFYFLRLIRDQKISTIRFIKE